MSEGDWFTSLRRWPSPCRRSQPSEFELRVVLTTLLRGRINTAYIEALSGLELAQANLEALRELVRVSATRVLASYCSVFCRSEQGR